MSLYYGGGGHQPRNKLRREGIERTVLPPLPGGQTYSAAYTYQGVGHTGYQQGSYSGGGGGGTASSIRSTNVGTASLLGGGSTSIRTSAAATGAKLQQRIEEVKERQKERRERHQTRRKPGEIQKTNLVVDADGIAHDSEYVQFRTATPVHVQARTARRQKRQVEGIPNDDGSASSDSSSSSSSSESGFQSSPYTYQSTHRTASSANHHHHHHHSSTLYPPTISAIPPYLTSSTHRSSIDTGSGTIPRAPSPSKRSSGEYDRTSLDRIGGSRPSSSTNRTIPPPPPGTGLKHQPSVQKFSTSSFQPPAAFNPHPPHVFAQSEAPLLGTRPGSITRNQPGGIDTNSLISSTNRLNLGGTGGGGGGSSTAGGGESGYNKYARDHKTRPNQTEGNVLDAGVHGMKRSWDGFKLDVRFGAHKMGKKMTRKVNSAIL